MTIVVLIMEWVSEPLSPVPPTPESMQTARSAFHLVSAVPDELSVSVLLAMFQTMYAIDHQNRVNRIGNRMRSDHIRCPHSSAKLDERKINTNRAQRSRRHRKYPLMANGNYSPTYAWCFRVMHHWRILYRNKKSSKQWLASVAATSPPCIRPL